MGDNISMVSDNLTDYDVLKTTTDKLEDMLCGYTEPWEIRLIQHVGGRDWVVVAQREFDSLADKCRQYGEDPKVWNA